MVVVPTLSPVAKPAALTVVKLAIDEVQVALAVMSLVVPPQ